MGETLPIDPSSGDQAQQTITALGAAITLSNTGIALNPKRLRNYPRARDRSIPIDSPDQTFDDCRTIEGWTDMIHKLLHAAWDDPQQTTPFQFSHDFNLLGNDPRALKGAVIVYEIISEEPAVFRGHTETKPRLREITNVDDGNNERTWIWAQSFDVVVAFNIYGDSWGRAIETTERFKELMLTYFGIFKQFGLQEIFYRGQMRDALYDPPKVQEFPNRTVFFKVRIERQYNINYQEIERVLITAGILNPVSGLSSDETISETATGITASPVLPAK